MRHVTQICCTYWCPRCKKDLVKVWNEKPWFGDYAKNCKCGRRLWPTIIRDYSIDVMSTAEFRWDRK